METYTCTFTLYYETPCTINLGLPLVLTVHALYSHCFTIFHQQKLVLILQTDNEWVKFEVSVFRSVDLPMSVRV